MWTFQRARGEMLDPDGNLAGYVYAGHGAARNNPALEGQHGEMDTNDNIIAGGPIPGGIYTMSQLLREGGHLGPFAIKLEPGEATRQRIIDFGREPDSFYVHGNNLKNDASEGCVIAGRPLRERMWNSADHQLLVV